MKTLMLLVAMIGMIGRKSKDGALDKKVGLSDGKPPILADGALD